MDKKLHKIERQHPAYNLVMEYLLTEAIKPKQSDPVTKQNIRAWLKSLLESVT